IRAGRRLASSRQPLHWRHPDRPHITPRHRCSEDPHPPAGERTNRTAMSDVVPQLVLIVVLVIVNAAFAGTELALVSLREAQLQRLETASSTRGEVAPTARPTD